MTGWIYTVLFFVILFAWPASLSEAVGQPYLAAVFLVNAATGFLIMHRFSSGKVSFFDGVEVIAG
jgi:hypothetical protein